MGTEKRRLAFLCVNFFILYSLFVKGLLLANPVCLKWFTLCIFFPFYTDVFFFCFLLVNFWIVFCMNDIGFKCNVLEKARYGCQDKNVDIDRPKGKNPVTRIRNGGGNQKLPGFPRSGYCTIGKCNFAWLLFLTFLPDRVWWSTLVSSPPKVKEK